MPVLISFTANVLGGSPTNEGQSDLLSAARSTPTAAPTATDTAATARSIDWVPYVTGADLVVDGGLSVRPWS